MICFEEYQALLKESETRPMNGTEHRKAMTFTKAQPSQCPQCGLQVFDPFGFGRVIHDVAKCGSVPQ
jgi:hypothetical protein